MKGQAENRLAGVALGSWACPSSGISLLALLGTLQLTWKTAVVLRKEASVYVFISLPPT